MKTLRLFLLLMLASPSIAFAVDNAAQRLERYEPAFKSFAEADLAKPVAKGGILLVGSSIFRLWVDAPEQMAPLPLVNRAFGGSRVADQLARFEQLVPVYAPKIIVYYCGSNDIKANEESPEVIFGRFREFSERVQSRFPGTRLIFVSTTRSPDRVELWDKVDHYNALARAYVAATPYHTYIDINPALVDANGHPKLELYRADKLHFHPPAYAAFTAIIKPVLTRVWAEVNVRTSSL
jgi:lysophospholipase L1-like esterase